MAQRGRKSAAALAVVPAFSHDQPPDPPVELTPEQAREWRAIVSQMPSDWFKGGVQPLLAQYCRHVATSRVLAEQINAFDPEWLKIDERLRRYGKLLAMHERESRALMTLATKMRLTQQSRYTPQAAGRAVRDVGSGLQPWEKHL